MLSHLFIPCLYASHDQSEGVPVSDLMLHEGGRKDEKSFLEVICGDDCPITNDSFPSNRIKRLNYTVKNICSKYRGKTLSKV